MSICSRHTAKVDGCAACDTDLMQWPEFVKKVREAEATGIECCKGCGYEYYRTVDSCPKCSFPRAASTRMKERP